MSVEPKTIRPENDVLDEMKEVVRLAYWAGAWVGFWVAAIVMCVGVGLGAGLWWVVMR